MYNMIGFDREVMMFVAIVLCIAASAFLYRELMKTKEEVKSYKVFTAQVAHRMARPIQILHDVQELKTPEPEPESQPEPEVQEIKEPKTPRKSAKKVEFAE